VWWRMLKDESNLLHVLQEHNACIMHYWQLTCLCSTSKCIVSSFLVHQISTCLCKN